MNEENTENIWDALNRTLENHEKLLRVLLKRVEWLEADVKAIKQAKVLVKKEVKQ